MTLFYDGSPAFDRCETLDGTVRTAHYYTNVAPGLYPVWVCLNCGLPR